VNRQAEEGEHSARHGRVSGEARRQSRDHPFLLN
jgi:hypothetical protein